MKLLPFVLGLVLLGVRVGSAQVVRVRIVDADTHLPIVAARVTLRATRDSVGTTALTDDRGVFSVRASAQGPHLIEVVRLGYRPQRLGPIEVGARDSAPIEVALLAVPVALDSLTVTARANSRLLERVGMYGRMRADFGHFITRDKIAARGAGRITDLLAGVPGVRLVPDAAWPGHVRVQMRGSQLAVGGLCEPRVYVDGLVVIRGDSKARVRAAGGAKNGDLEDPFEDTPKNPDPPLDDLANPNDIEAIEVYRSAAQVPAEFGGSGVFTRCGVVVIWTRRGR